MGHCLHPTTAFAVVLMTAAINPYAAAQCQSQWLPGEGIPGVNGEVHAVTTWDPDGPGVQPEVLVVGGSFTVAGDILANNIATWNGTSWKAVGAGLNGDVRALTVYNGNLIAAGNFTLSGGAII